MEFLKRKHFSLWIITLILAVLVNITTGLQGIPTWICLGVRSPFIEFRNEVEVLANTSIPLNITKDEQALMHQEGLKKQGTYIKPVDLRDAITGYVKDNFTKKLVPNFQGRKRGSTNPILDELEQKPIVLLDEDTDENGLPASLTEEDRKFIVPMALKNVTPDPKISSTPSTTVTTPTTTTTTTATPEFASNIDDLKNHILFLQNMTKHNSNFQSKFVVFPSLQKDKSLSTTTKSISTTPTTTTQRSVFLYTPPMPPPTRRSTYLSYVTSTTPHPYQFDHYVDNEDPVAAIQREKITIVPQVLLLNDQTPPDDNEEDSRQLGEPKDPRVVYSRRRNFQKTTTAPSLTSTISTSPTSSSIKPLRRSSKRPTNNGEKRNKNQRKPCKNPDSPKCQRQRRRQEQRYQQSPPVHQPFIQTINNTKRFAVSIEIPDSFKINQSQSKGSYRDLKLSRFARSNHKRRNIGNNKFVATYGSTLYDAPTREFIISGGQFGINGQMFMNNTPNPTAAAYSEPIDLNPDLCYEIEGLSYGQKKLCMMHTNVMPAVSRGARSAIQECQYQFKNRRWNCSTTDDSSVFGPMTGLGTPEMAFIHALASAAVTSFIARACRDGQLSSCGCSRGTRPRQLHDDWAWGGCGDDMEYAYKFSQDFVDIREKERKRGTRGLASGPRIKNDEKYPNKSQSSSSNLRANITATDAIDAPFNIGSSSGENIGVGRVPATERQNGVTSTPVHTLRNGHANITVNVDSDNKSNSSDFYSASSPFSSLIYKDNIRKDEESIDTGSHFKPEVLLELQERITKEILNSKLKENEMIELQEKINREILNSKVFNLDQYASVYGKKKKNQRAVNSMGTSGNNMMGIMANGGGGSGRLKNLMSAKARSLMNLHNNEAGRRAVFKKARIICKCHGVSGSCSLITCWQQLSSIREIGDYLREKYDEATEVKLNKRGRLQVKDPQFKVPTAHDLVYLDESPDWCRNNRQLQWPGTHGRTCNKTSSGLDGCSILCCGRGYNTKNIVVRERCNCKFHWCCQVKCDICVKVLEEHTCK